MRDFFIRSLERIVSVVVILLAVFVAVGGIAVMFAGPGQGGGLLPGLAIWAGGAIYVLVVGGFLYLALGIHDNTRRTAEAVERLAAGK